MPALHRLLLTLASHRVVLSSEVKPSGAVQRVALGMQGAAKGWVRSREVADWVKSCEDGARFSVITTLSPGTQLVPNKCLCKDTSRWKEGGEERKKERRAGRKKRQTSQYWVAASFDSGPEFESHLCTSITQKLMAQP